MDIITLAAARKGSGGGASKEYVDEKVAALIDDTTAAQNKTYSSAKVDEKVAGEEITTTATGSDLTLSTAAGSLNTLTVYGKSEVVDGNIKSAGEGYAVVDLGTLNWAYYNYGIFFTTELTQAKPLTLNCICEKYITRVVPLTNPTDKTIYIASSDSLPILRICDTDYTDATAFKNSLSGVLLAYQLADPTQGNTIAVKTDNGSGIDGTMAVFETGTPLYGVSDSIRDVMVWNGSAGTVTKNCGEVDLGTLTWEYNSSTLCFVANMPNDSISPVATGADGFCAKYTKSSNDDYPDNKQFTINNLWISSSKKILIKDTDYTDPADFKIAMSGVKLIYPLATPTTQNLTSTENDSIAALRTFEPQTHAQNNATADMTIEAYAGTANGKAVNELKQDVQSEISALKITQSDTLTLTTSGWSNNTQVIAYAHDTAKRNVIDVDPASIEEWANCGVLATAETASGITFTCKTVPTNALNFKVTSMGV